MDIECLGVDHAGLLNQVVDFYAESDAVDCPWLFGLTARSLRVFITRGWDTEPETFVVGREGAEVVAAGFVSMPTRENTDSAWLGATVDPSRRRQGLGSEVFAYLESMATDAGRTTLGTWGWDTPATHAFAAGRGYGQRSVDTQRRLDLHAMSAKELDAVVTETQDHAGDYELLPLVGPLPEELLEAYLGAVSAINDAPLDDLTYDDEVHDAQRLRHYEGTQDERGVRLYRVLARHRATGQIGGHTVVGVELDRPQYAEQHDTSVSRAHRGHRLGLLLKAEMARWLRQAEPDLRWVMTQNAESNAHMIAVNDRLGYQAVGRQLVYQRDESSQGAGSDTGTT